MSLGKCSPFVCRAYDALGKMPHLYKGRHTILRSNFNFSRNLIMNISRQHNLHLSRDSKKKMIHSSTVSTAGKAFTEFLCPRTGKDRKKRFVVSLLTRFHVTRLREPFEGLESTNHHPRRLFTWASCFLIILTVRVH